MPDAEDEKSLLSIIKEFNKIMSSSVEGPNCTDPDICHADCCHIKIDIPKLLAEYYINIGVAIPGNFVRGDIFSLKLAVDPRNSKCIFYGKNINGCSLHKTLMKPLHCWIYPTGFSNAPSEAKIISEDGTISCKRATGWKVTNEEKAQDASKLLQKYVKFCMKEFENENSPARIKKRLKKIKEKFNLYSPKSIAGIKDVWDGFEPLLAEGISLKLKKYCEATCSVETDSFYMECENTCHEIALKIFENLLDDTLNFISKNGAKEFYTFFELWERK